MSLILLVEKLIHLMLGRTAENVLEQCQEIEHCEVDDQIISYHENSEIMIKQILLGLLYVKIVILIISFFKRRLATVLLTVELCRLVIEAFSPILDGEKNFQGRLYSVMFLFTTMQSTYFWADLLQVNGTLLIINFVAVPLAGATQIDINYTVMSILTNIFFSAIIIHTYFIYKKFYQLYVRCEMD